MAKGIDVLIKDFYAKYEPEKYSEEQVSKVKDFYKDDYNLLIKDFYAKYEPEKYSEEQVSSVVDFYDLKKKESTPSESLDGQSPSQEDELQIKEEQTTPQTDTPFGADWETKTTEPDTFEEIVEKKIGVTPEQVKESEKKKSREEVLKNVAKGGEDVNQNVYRTPKEDLDDLISDFYVQSDLTDKSEAEKIILQKREDYINNKTQELKSNWDNQRKDYWAKSGLKEDVVENLVKEEKLENITNSALSSLDIDDKDSFKGNIKRYLEVRNYLQELPVKINSLKEDPDKIKSINTNENLSKSEKENQIKEYKDSINKEKKALLQEYKDLTKEVVTLDKDIAQLREKGDFKLIDPVTGKLSEEYSNLVKEKEAGFSEEAKTDFNKFQEAFFDKYYKIAQINNELDSLRSGVVGIATGETFYNIDLSKEGSLEEFVNSVDKNFYGADNIIETTVGTFEEKPKSHLTEESARLKYKQAKALLESLREENSSYQAMSRALLLNEDPATVSKGFAMFEGIPVLEEVGEFATSFGESAYEEFSGKEVFTDKDFRKLYVQEAKKAGLSLTEGQIEQATDTFSEKLGDTIGVSSKAMADIVVSTLITKKATNLLKIPKYAKRFQALARLKKGSKYADRVYNIMTKTGNVVSQGIAYELADQGFMTGTGESIGSGIVGEAAKVLSKGKYGKILTLLSKVIGGAGGETFSEYAGEFANQAFETGLFNEETFAQVFGRDYDEAKDKFLLTAVTSLMFGTAAETGKVLSDSKAYFEGIGDTERASEVAAMQESLKEEGPDTFLEKADKEVESITEKTDDKKEIDIEKEIEEVLKGVEEKSAETISQVLDSENILEKINNGESVNIESANQLTEKIFSVLDSESVEKGSAKEQKLFDIIDKIDEYENKTKTVKETTSQTRVFKSVKEGSGEVRKNTIRDLVPGSEATFGGKKGRLEYEEGKLTFIGDEGKKESFGDGTQLFVNGLTTENLVTNENGNVIGIKVETDKGEVEILNEELGLDTGIELMEAKLGEHPWKNVEMVYEEVISETEKEIPIESDKGISETAEDLKNLDTKDPSYIDRAYNFLDKLEKSIDKGGNTLSTLIPPSVIKEIIKIAKALLKPGVTFKQAVDNAILDYIGSSKFDNLTEEQKSELEKLNADNIFKSVEEISNEKKVDSKLEQAKQKAEKKIRQDSDKSTESKVKKSKLEKEVQKQKVSEAKKIGKDTSAETKSTIAKDLKKRIIDLSKGSKLGVKAVKQKLNDIKTAIKEHAAKGKLSQRQTQSILAKVEKTNFDKIESVKELDTHVENILNDVEYADKKSAANTLQKQLKKVGKAKDSLTKDTAVKLGNLPIHKIKDIDSFLALGESLVNSLRGKEVLLSDYKNKLDEFMEKAEKDIAQYDSDLQEAKLEKAYDDFGGKDSGLTYEEFKEYVDLKADDSIEKELDKETVSKIEKLRSVLPFEIAALEQYAKDNPNDVSKSLLNKLKNLDLSELSPSQVLDVHNAITEVVVFDSPKGVGRIETMLEGKEKAKQVKNTLSGKIIGAIDSIKKASLLSYPQFIKAITKTKEAGKSFNEKIMGAYNVGYNKAVLSSDKFMNNLDKIFNKMKNSYQSSVNTGMVGWMIQHEVGLTEEEIQQDFENKKKSIENQLNRLKNLSTPVNEVKKNEESLTKERDRLEEEKKKANTKEEKAEISAKLQDVKDKLSVLTLKDRSRNHYKNTYESYKAAYDNLIKDANSKSELESKLSKEERQALKFIESEFAKNKDSFKDVNERYNGKTIVEYERYTPTYAKKMGGEASDIDLINGVPDLKAKDVSVKEAGSAQKRVAVDVTGNTLYSFDLNAIAKQRMYEQQYEINTLKERQVLKSMLSDKSMQDVMYSNEFLNVLKQRTARVAQLRKAKVTDDLNTMSKGFSKFVYKAMRNLKLTHLRTLDQYIKQTVPILIQTSTQASRGMGVALKQGVKMMTSKAHREAFSDIIKRSEVAIRATDGELALDPSNKSLLENILGVFRKEGTMVSRAYSNIIGDAVGNSDSFATRTSWLALLAKEAKKAGIPYSEFDLVKHKDLITNDIISKADTESTGINNSSDFTQASDTFTNPDKKFIRELFWTYKSFSLNLAVNNLIEFRNLKYGSAGDKAASARYILGSMMGVMAFQAVKEFVVNSMIYDPLLASTLGLEEDDEDVSKQASEVALKAAADYFTGWMPANFDLFAKQSANYVNSEIIKKQLADMSESEKQMLEREGDLPNPKHSLFFDNNEVFTGSLGILYDALKQSGEVGENLLNEEELNASDEYKAISLIGLLSGEGNVSRIFQKAYYKAKKEEKKESN